MFEVGEVLAGDAIDADSVICINLIPISATQYWETPGRSFRVGAEDAPYLAREFVGQFDEADQVQLPNYRIYLKLMIDGSPSKPFSAVTLGAATIENP
jgi:hypothetical protein